MTLDPTLIRAKALVSILIPGCVTLGKSHHSLSLFARFGTAPCLTACGSGHEGRWTQGMKSVWPAQLLWKYQEPGQPGFTIFRRPEGPRGSPAGPQPRSPTTALAAATSPLPDPHFLCPRGCQENPPMTPASHLESCEEEWLKETTPTSRSPGRAGLLGLHNLILA